MPVGPYFADFLCRETKVIIELDGDSHDFSVTEDARRTAMLEESGYRILRFDNRDVFRDTDGVLAAIAEALKQLPTPALRASPSRKREGI